MTMRALMILVAALIVACEAPKPPASSETAAAAPRVAPPAPAPEPQPAQQPTKIMPVSPPPIPAIDPSWKTHTDRRSNISFRYPSDYLLRQTRTRDDETAIVLMPDDKFARDYMDGKLKRPPADAPMQISIWLRKHDRKDGSFEAWLRQDMKKAQTEAPLEPVKIGPHEALTYKTDGLWQGQTVVIERPDLLIQAHIDFNAPEDRLRKDFDTILSSLSW